MPVNQDLVLQAMKSDLGVGRVDDLELENGNRGQTLRPGQVGQRSQVKLALPAPKNPQPLANRWKVAIQQGEFDDDDAETVKGLERIAGGRLHAQNSTAPFAAHLLPQKRPPPGPPYSEHITAPRRHDFIPEATRHQSYCSNSNPSTKLSQERLSTGRPVAPVTTVAKTDHQSTASAARGNNTATGSRTILQPSYSLDPASQCPQKPPSDVAINGAFHKSSQSVTYPRAEPEPQEYFYKADIHVGDRLAKGKGTVYLVAATPTDAGTFCIYLEGAKYLEYPISRMFNYIANATQLCPQFKEDDGVSITTTALIFGSQERITSFMQAVKTLKSRHQLSAPYNQAGASDATPIQLQLGAVKTLPRPNTITEAASGPRKDQRENDMVSSNEVASPSKMVSSSLEANKQSTQAPTAATKSCELVDVSMSEEAGLSRSAARTCRPSSYAIDLKSLVSFPSITPTPPGMASGTVLHMNSFNAPPSAFPPGEAGSIRHPEPSSVGRETLSAVILLDQKEMLRRSLVDLLPKFETMQNLLSTISQEYRDSIAKYIFTSIRETSGTKNATMVKLILKTLITHMAQDPKPEASSPLPVLAENLRYTRNEILGLRPYGVPPPESLAQLDFLPQSNNNVSADDTVTVKELESMSAPSQSLGQCRVSSLRPDASTFTPENGKYGHQACGTDDAENEIQMISTAAVAEFTATKSVSTLDPLPSVTAASVLPHSSVHVHQPEMKKGLQNSRWVATDDIYASIAHHSTDKPTAIKGLQNSRWAVPNDNIYTRNSDRFTGIGIPAQCP